MIRKKTILIASILILLIAGALIVYGQVRKRENQHQIITEPPLPPAQTQPDTPPAVPVQIFDKTKYSLDQPGSLWVVVNKKRPLPAEFVPQLIPASGGKLQAEAAQALEKLIKAGATAKAPLKIISSYRSYSTQQSLYSSYVQKDGQAAADTYSARPGHSEHQTGMAVDLGNSSGQCDLEICFAKTTGGTWLASNALSYGFIIRYTEDKTAVTGYQYEPWHIRYVGVDLARELTTKKQTMEEFFGLPAAPGY